MDLQARIDKEWQDLDAELQAGIRQSTQLVPPPTVPTTTPGSVTAAATPLFSLGALASGALDGDTNDAVPLPLPLPPPSPPRPPSTTGLLPGMPYIPPVVTLQDMGRLVSSAPRRTRLGADSSRRRTRSASAPRPRRGPPPPPTPPPTDMSTDDPGAGVGAWSVASPAPMSADRRRRPRAVAPTPSPATGSTNRHVRIPSPPASLRSSPLSRSQATLTASSTLPRQRLQQPRRRRRRRASLADSSTLVSARRSTTVEQHLRQQVEDQAQEIDDLYSKVDALDEQRQAALQAARDADGRVVPLERKLAESEDMLAHLRSLVAEYISKARDGDRASQTDQRFWNGLLDHGLLEDSQPPISFRPDTQPWRRDNEMEVLRRKLRASLQDQKALRGRVHLLEQETQQLRQSGVTGRRSAEKQITQQRMQLKGALRRIEFLVQQRTELQREVMKRQSYIARLERELLRFATTATTTGAQPRRLLAGGKPPRPSTSSASSSGQRRIPGSRMAPRLASGLLASWSRAPPGRGGQRLPESPDRVVAAVIPPRRRRTNRPRRKLRPPDITDLIEATTGSSGGDHTDDDEHDDDGHHHHRHHHDGAAQDGFVGHGVGIAQYVDDEGGAAEEEEKGREEEQQEESPPPPPSTSSSASRQPHHSMHSSNSTRSHNTLSSSVHSQRSAERVQALDALVDDIRRIDQEIASYQGSPSTSMTPSVSASVPVPRASSTGAVSTPSTAAAQSPSAGGDSTVFTSPTASRGTTAGPDSLSIPGGPLVELSDGHLVTDSDVNALLQASLCSEPTEDMERAASANSMSLWDTKADIDAVVSGDGQEEEEEEEEEDDGDYELRGDDSELDDRRAEQLQRAMLSFYSNVSSTIPGEDDTA